MYKFFRIFVYFVCLSGCVYQLSYVSQEYFAYKTTTRVESQLQDIVRYPSIILCSQIKDFVDDTKLGKYNLTSIDNLYELTIAQLHDLTPPANDLISKCYLRVHGYFKAYPSKECYSYFKTRKLVADQNICYEFHANAELNYSIDHVANAFNYSSIVYDLELGHHFENSTDMFMVAHYPAKHEDESGKIRFPANSRKFGEPFSRHRHERWILIRPSEESYKLLPAPYDTSCIIDNEYCPRDCYIQNTLKMLDRYPYTEPADEELSQRGISLHSKILSRHDLKNDTAAATWLEIEKLCYKKCSKPGCTMTMTSNSVNIYHKLVNAITALSVTLSVPRSYPKKVTSVPEVNWIEFLSGISNSISIWFGISVASITSLKFIKTSKRTHFKSWSRSVALVLCYLISFVGFLYQSTELCKDYFLYQTSMSIEVSDLDVYPYQSTGICLDYHELLNRDNYQEYGIARTLLEADKNLEKEYSSLTIKEILALTPSNNESVMVCSIRDKWNLGLKKLGSEECLNLFLIEKAVRGLNICYYFIPPTNMTYSWTKVASSFLDRTQVYKIHTSIRLNRSILATVTSYDAFDDGSGYSLPFDSRIFVQELLLYPENLVTLSSVTNNYIRLPAPYDTKCIRDFIYLRCLHFCMEKNLLPIKRNSYSSLTKYPHDYKVLNFKDVRNKSISDLAFNAFEVCRLECVGSRCEQTITFTTAEIYVKNNEKEVQLISILPSTPTVNIHYIPSTYPLNFFINICNCFGIWFGLSIISFNPITVWRKGKSLIARKHQVVSSKSKCLPTIVLLICVTGFLWQGSFVSITYFSYKTFSRLEMSREDVLRFPTINFCSLYTRILISSATKASVDLKNLTVTDIFKLTPHETETLSGCKLREQISDEMKLRSVSDCLTEFVSSKFVAGAAICYAYQARSSYSLGRVTSSSDHTGLVYELLLSEVFRNTSDISIYWITQSLNTSEMGQVVRSKKFAYQVFRDADSNNSVNYVVSRGINHNVTLLPEPYDTQCLPNNSPIGCFSKCYIKFFKALKRVPFDEFISEPIDLQMVTSDDIKNETFQELVRIANSQCERACVRQPCNQYYSITDVSGYWRPKMKHNSLVIAAGTPVSNGLVINTYPSLVFLDFLNNLGVSGSIWLGVSVVSITMYSMKLLTKKRVNEKARQSKKRRLSRTQKQFNISPRSYCCCSYCQKHYRGPNTSLLFMKPFVQEDSDKRDNTIKKVG